MTKRRRRTCIGCVRWTETEPRVFTRQSDARTRCAKTRATVVESSACNAVGLIGGAVGAAAPTVLALVEMIGALLLVRASYALYTLVKVD